MTINSGSATNDSLQALLSPRSIAIVGASDDDTRIGGRPIRHLKRGGFAGPIYPINPKREEVQGLKAWPSIDTVPGPVDCAILALPASAIVNAAQDCIRCGVRALVIFSAGFAEAGDDGKRWQRELTALAREHGVRIVGPNCLGVFNVVARSYLTFTDLFEACVPASGHVAIVSQSGGFASNLLKQAQRRHLPVGHWITTGNECDIEIGEALRAVANEPAVKVLMVYVEGLRAGDAFIEGLAIARERRIPVIALKVGRTEAGAVAAASHTAALAGADPVYDAVFREFGVYRADNAQQMLDVAYAAYRSPLPDSNRLAAVTASGGVGALIADQAAAVGLELTPVPEAAQRRILELAPYASTSSPVDITGQFMNDVSLLGNALDALLDTGAYSAVLVFMGMIADIPNMAQPLIASLRDVQRRHPRQTIVLSIIAGPDIVAAYEEAGFLVYDDPAHAVLALGALAAISANFRREDHASIALEGMPALPAGNEAFNEVEAKALLARAGVPMPRETIAVDAEGAASAASELGFPVSLKVVSRDLAHKSDVGGVALNLLDADAVRVALETMWEQIARQAPQARIAGFLVTPMVSGVAECIVGVRCDPLFGPIVMFGLGGVWVELMKDVTLRRAPVSVREAHAMIREIRGFALLDGYRGKPRADLDALAQTIAAVSRFAAVNAQQIESLELNPVLALPAGAGVAVLDAVINRRAPG